MNLFSGMGGALAGVGGSMVPTGTGGGLSHGLGQDDNWFASNADPSQMEYWRGAAGNAAGNTGITGGMTGPGPLAGTQGAAGKDAFGRAWTQSGGRTVEDLKNFAAQNPQYGVTLGGSKGDKVYGPGGEFWADAVLSAGTGGNGASWQTETGGGGQGGGYQAGQPFVFGQDDPSYKWRLQQGLEGVQKSAAARGTLLSGGTLKDLTDYAQGAASQEYGNAWGRNFNQQQADRGEFQNAFGRQFNVASLGLNAANSAANTGSSYGTNVANLYGAQGNANAAGTLAQGDTTASTLGGLFGVAADYAPDASKWIKGIFGKKA